MKRERKRLRNGILKIITGVYLMETQKIF